MSHYHRLSESYLLLRQVRDSDCRIVCFYPTKILACSLFLISGFDFLWLASRLRPWISLTVLLPIWLQLPTHAWLLDTFFATAFCTVKSLTSRLNFGTNKGIRLSHFLVRVWLLHTPWQFNLTGLCSLFVRRQLHGCLFITTMST